MRAVYEQLGCEVIENNLLCRSRVHWSTWLHSISKVFIDRFSSKFAWQRTGICSLSFRKIAFLKKFSIIFCLYTRINLFFFFHDRRLSKSCQTKYSFNYYKIFTAYFDDDTMNTLEKKKRSLIFCKYLSIPITFRI